MAWRYSMTSEDERETHNESNTSEEHCVHHESPAIVAWRPSDSYSDKHQYMVPGTCSQCGAELEYVYNEAGVRDVSSNEYVITF